MRIHLLPAVRHLAPYSRLDHSRGVPAIVWEHTGDEAQAVAGLLHDIATPVFAHVIDFLHGDYMKQESTEDRTREMISGSPEITALLSQAGIPVDAVADYHRYPVADNDSPKLSADRLEYTLGNMVNFGFASAETEQGLYGDLSVGRNESGEPELMFSRPDLALAFARLSLACSEVYSGDADRYVMQILSELVRDAVAQGVLAEDDLYLDEPAVIGKLTADAAFRRRWETFRAMEKVYYPDADTPAARIVDAKRRCIDPYVAGQGRVSVLFPEYGNALDAYRNKRLDYRIAAG